MKRTPYLYIALLVALMLHLNIYADNATPQKVVKIGYFSSTNFQDGADGKSPKGGYAYRYIMSIANFTNWKYEYVYGHFKELYPKLLNGEIDAMAGLSLTDKRATDMIFPEEPMGNKNYYIYGHGDDHTLSADRKTLKGKKIGVVEGGTMDKILHKWMQDHPSGLIVVKFDDFHELFESFEARKLDCIVAYDSDSSIVHSVKPIIKMGEVPYFLVFNKNRTDLVEDYNRAIGMINEIEPHFVQSLLYEFYGNNIVCNSISPIENQWLSTHKEVRIGYMNNYLPYSSTTPGGNVTGLVTNVIDEMNKRLDITGTLSPKYTGFDNYDNMLNALKKGEIDVAFPVAGNVWNAEQDGIFVSVPVVSSSMTLVFKYQINGETDDRIAVNRNNRMQLYYTQNNYPKAEIVYCNSIDDCLDAVKTGKANSTIVNGIRVNSLLANSQYQGLSYVTLSNSDERCFGVKSGNYSILMLLNRGLELIGNDFGSTAAHMYVHVNYSSMDFIREHAVLIMLAIVCFCAFIVWIILREQRKTARFVRETELKNQELQKARAEAEYANSAKTKFLSNMSHDIRTPMNAILGFTNLAQTHINNTPTVANYLEKINVSSRHLLSLINEILDMSRIESGKIKLNENELSVSDLIDNLRVITEEGAKEKGLTLEFSKESIHDEYVFADKLRLSQILVNIVGNAIKYTNKGGWVKVCVAQTDKISNGHATYEFHIKDNGIGMSEEFQKHLFEAFTRESTATISHIQGTGLGMAITKSLVDMMQGSIEVKSKTGEGSEFIVTISLPVSVHPRYYHEKEETGYDNVSFAGKRVLIVEDNELNQEIAKSILEEIGLKVELADNGQIAVDIISEKPVGYYDVVLMDIQMPVLDGYEATKAIRHLADKEKAKVPIVAMTANAFDEDKRKAFDMGMNGHLAKPIDHTKLVEVLRWVMNRKKL